MLLRSVRRRGLLVLPLMAAMVATAVATPAYARSIQGDSAATPAQAAPSNQIFSITDQLARGLARTFADSSVERSVSAAAAKQSIDLLTVEPGSVFAERAHAANQAVVAAKGLPSDVGSILRLRLADPSMSAAIDRGEIPLVAATPTDDAVTAFAAYTSTGAAVTIDTANIPQRPVLLVEVNTAKALPAGVHVMQQILSDNGVGHQVVSTASTTGYWATKIDAVELSNDEEPWWKGAAEIYSIVGGFDLNGVATVNIVQMPYLDYDGTIYYPNQLLVQFNNYKYNLADVVMMEDDGDTNYQSLAEAITDALLTIADQGQYIPLVNPILNAIPESWWTDDPDYVDSWYTLATTTSGRIYGAAANGWMDVEPYWVSVL